MNKQERKKLETKIIKEFSSTLKPNDTIVIGISGGPDSIFLLHLLDIFRQKNSLNLIITHINHKLRGRESDKDEEFVKKHAEKLKNSEKKGELIFYSTISKIISISKKTRAGIEESGRKVRYDFFKKLAQKHQAKYILTAHHADDNFETILLNLTRGATLQGMIGIQKLTPLKKGPLLYRPLLNITKKEIENYLKEENLKYRIDLSNKDIKYRRNFIRHNIIPEFKKINPNIIQTITKNIENLREIDDLLQTESKEWIKKKSLNKAATKVDAKSFRALHPALQKNILLTLHELHIGNKQDIENNHIKEVITLINNNIGNKKKKLSKLTFSIKANTISIEKN